MTDKQPDADTRCGFVAIIGAPNAGKSTLINSLVGGKVSIVSSKVQTTRTVVRGMVARDKSQLVFIDTPGLFAPQRRLERAMVAAAWESRNEADMIVLVCDASSKGAVRETGKIIARMKKSEESAGKPCVLALNKTDLLSPPELLPLTQDFNARYDFAATFMISARNSKGTDDLLKWLAKNAKPGPWHYPEDQMSDMSERLVAAEITREKLFRRLHNELPHALTVETENWNVRADGSIMIHQVITIERDSQKSIVLGRAGSMIKVIGQDARVELSEIFGVPVHLKLFVKVHEEWADNPELYRMWGLDFKS